MRYHQTRTQHKNIVGLIAYKISNSWQQIIVATVASTIATLCILNVVMASERNAADMSALKMVPMGAEQVGEPVTVLQAEILSTEISSVVTGFIVRTTVRQQFRNSSTDWMEGMYQFPLPDDAAVDEMVLIIGERRIVSEIQEKKQALKTYQKAAIAGKKAALLSQQRPNMFSTSVANIEPGGDIVVELSFQSLAAQDGVNFSWRMPQAITPRYNSPSAATYIQDANVTASDSHYDRRGDRNPTSFRILMQKADALSALESPSHDIDLSEGDDRARVIKLANGALPADKDFVLHWQYAQGDEASTVVFFEDGEDARYILGMVLPPKAATEVSSAPRDITFVIDVSGSMHGLSMEQARKALTKGLELLGPKDRFDIIAFNDKTWRLFGQSRAVTAANLAQAYQFIGGLQADRGTEMYPALSAALLDVQSEDYLRQIMFLTDGAVSNEQRMFDLVKKTVGPARLFTVGLGSAPNGWFMRKAAEQGRGVHLQVSNLANTQSELESLFYDMSAPTLQNIELQLSESSDFYPRQIPDLFGQRPLTFVARHDQSAAPIRIAAVGPQGQPWSYDFEMSEASTGSGISKLWAGRKIESLTDARARGMSADLVREAVLDVSLTHGVLSEFTSFVAVDQTPVRVRQDFLKKVQLKGNLPQGTSWEKFYGPKTASPMIWQLTSGLVLLMLAIALFFAVRRRVGT
ncbi:MAG: marine proteobacterial sortase target protein [Sneathiella sp.]|uniref:marine proteobacterial sortase target protein n=1 Tax=Sneathiella sp. TaxID=1964365 RepID=UPI003002BF93